MHEYENYNIYNNIYTTIIVVVITVNRALKTLRCVPMLSLLDPNKVAALKCVLTPTTPCFTDP